MATELNVVHANEHYLVIDKPADLLSVPGRTVDKQDCVVSRARARFPDLPEQPAVHRLDMQTSGLMLLARNKAAHRYLAGRFQQRLVSKRYIALLAGHLTVRSGVIELAFRLDPDNRPYQVFDPVRGKQGTTLWRTLQEEGRNTRVEFTPLTGRTHQLRLHAAHPAGLGLPIVGDRLYGSGKEGDTLLLHASYLSFNDPATNRLMSYESIPPF